LGAPGRTNRSSVAAPLPPHPASTTSSTAAPASSIAQHLRRIMAQGKHFLTVGWKPGRGRPRHGKESTRSFHSQHIAHRGTCGKTRVVPQNRWPRPEPAEMGVAKCVCCCPRMGRGDVEPMVGLAVRLRALGAEVRVRAPLDFAATRWASSGSNGEAWTITSSHPHATITTSTFLKTPLGASRRGPACSCSARGLDKRWAVKKIGVPSITQ
jgi:hypothetical protein